MAKKTLFDPNEPAELTRIRRSAEMKQKLATALLAQGIEQKDNYRSWTQVLAQMMAAATGTRLEGQASELEDEGKGLVAQATEEAMQDLLSANTPDKFARAIASPYLPEGVRKMAEYREGKTRAGPSGIPETIATNGLGQSMAMPGAGVEVSPQVYGDQVIDLNTKVGTNLGPKPTDEVIRGPGGFYVNQARAASDAMGQGAVGLPSGPYPDPSAYTAPPSQAPQASREVQILEDHAKALLANPTPEVRAQFESLYGPGSAEATINQLKGGF